MDYHQDRFEDHSLLVYKNSTLAAVLPANQKNEIIQSHGGLSYGGLIYTIKLRAKDVLEIFTAILSYYKQLEFKELYYKCVPDIYSAYPAQEASYALFRLGGSLYRRDISSTISLRNRIKLSKGRKWLLARAKKGSIDIKDSVDFNLFFSEYNVHLKKKYGVLAVHTPEEMSLLNSRFPNHIKLFTASDNEGYLGGMILYCTKQVIHAQYIHFTDRGKEIGGFDLLMSEILEVYKDRNYFDFGISTEQNGKYLNEGLINFKESFGARGTVCDFYKFVL